MYRTLLSTAFLKCKSENNFFTHAVRCYAHKRNFLHCVDKESKDPEVCKLAEQNYLEERTLLRITGKTRQEREQFAKYGDNPPKWYNDWFTFRQRPSEGTDLPWRERVSLKYDKFKESAWGKKPDEKSTYKEDITNE